MNTRSTARVIVGGVVALIAVDLATKLVAPAFSSGSPNGLIVPLRNPEFSLGTASAAFGVMLALATLGIAAAALVTVRPALRGELPAWIPICVVGGALGNLVDRAAFGSVHDFIALGWIVVNVADIAVVAGLIGLIVHRRARHGQPAPELVEAV
jgi:signal peptidase II